MCEDKSLEIATPPAFLGVAVPPFCKFLITLMHAWIGSRKRANLSESRCSFPTSVVEYIKSMLYIKSCFLPHYKCLVGHFILAKPLWNNEALVWNTVRNKGTLKMTYLCLCSKSMIKMVCEPRSSESSCNIPRLLSKFVVATVLPGKVLYYCLLKKK